MSHRDGGQRRSGLHGQRVDHKGLYRLVELDLLFQVLLHDPVVVIDTVVMEVVHLSCGRRREGRDHVNNLDIRLQQSPRLTCWSARYLVMNKTWC